MTSKIEWTTETWNIITGCTKHSEGCKNCYAEKMHKRLTGMGQEKYKEPFSKVVFHSAELNRVIGKNKLVFVNSMSDTFHEEISDSEINWLLTACQVQPFNQFQILTKRAYRLPDFKYPENVWLGVTVENLKHKDRIEYLKKTNAKIKFLSCEPMLSDLGGIDLTGIDWVIAGGETGSGARAVHPHWLLHLMNQCKAQNVPFFFKQWGEWIPETMLKEIGMSNFAGSGILLNYDGTIANFEDPGDKQYLMLKVGKKKAGSKLFDKEYKEYPAWKQLWDTENNCRK